MGHFSSPLQSTDTPPSMLEIAFQAIKKAIMRKEFLSGNIYSEQVVAKEMGMSKRILLISRNMTVPFIVTSLH